MFEPEAVEPEIGDVLQETDALPAVRVQHAGPVTVHELPTRVSHSRSINVTNSASGDDIEQIAGEDLRRKYLVISTTAFPIFVGHDKQSVMDGTAGILPVGQVLELPTGAPVWVRAAAVGTAVVSYWSGYWAD